MNRVCLRMVGISICMAWCVIAARPLSAAEPTKEGGWLVQRDEQTQILVKTMDMTLHARGEPRPALKYRLIPDPFEAVEGNAAIYYLKAMGFLEQSNTRDRLSEIFKETEKRSRSEGKDYDQLPPYIWQSMTPQQLPLPEVKQFLELTSFQPQFLREAAQRRRFELDRNISQEHDPIAYLLPEIQSMRELARTQSLRCKVAIAEGRIDDAIATLGQQYALAWHLGQDEFLVSNLVGAACAGIAWDDALYLVQHPDTPNLYWAFASLPRPLIDMQRANALERQLLYEQFKVLREVSEKPRPAGYWRDFVDRLTQQIGGLAYEIRLWQPNDPQATRALVTGYIAAAYPRARQFLIEECGLPREQVEAYPTAQTVFLAIVRYYDLARDETFKWTYLPSWQQEQLDRGARLGAHSWDRPELAGWHALPCDLLLPAVRNVHTAAARVQQGVALVQTVEAIRIYGALHDGRLPPTLDELPVPAPLEPFTGKPLDYEYHHDRAVLSGHILPGMQYRLVLRFATKTSSP